MNPEIMEEIGIFAYLLIGILLVTGVINIFTAYNNRHKEYKTISSVTVTRTLAQNVGIIIFGLFKYGAVGLLFSQIFGLLVGVKKQGKHLYQKRHILKEIQLKDVKKTLRKYKQLPLFSMPAQFVNTTSYSILNYFITGLFGLAMFGYYAIAYRILGLPLNVISMNVSKVFFQKASADKLNIGNYNGTLKKITLLLFCISIPMVIFLILFAPWLFDLVFGEGWDIAGEFVQILAPMYGFRFIVSALTPALVISGKQKLELLIQNLFIVCSVCSFFVCKIFDLDIYGFLTLISISYSVVYILFYIIIYKLSIKKI